jgi:23S rRNA (cytosine1962-C5)-methyltransferase
LKLQFQTGQDIIFIDKPAGLPTHAPDVGRPGLVEILERRLGQKLWVVHRLDKSTTGAMLFATSAARAEELRQAFEKHQVSKTYWFVTDKSSTTDEFERESLIEKVGSSSFQSTTSPSPNAKTRFKRLKRSPFFELWEARPLSGKPHQVRLHAADIGLPILGDLNYGGSSFPHLCLHSNSIELPGEPIWTCPAPRFFERLGLAKDKELTRLLSSIDRRQRLFHFLKNSEETLRLVHNENADFRLDLLGPVLWCHWYKDESPREEDLERWDFIQTLLKRPLVIQKRDDRGKDPNSQKQWLLGEVPDTWTALENGRKAEFRKVQGLSAGLFLDQRLNRDRVQELSRKKTVLNLFSYTSLFSVAAAQGGATKVTTVDLSKNFLEWSRRNFTLNPGALATETEWSAADSFLFLRGAIKRERKWDLVICDPPSFSRGEKGVFRLKDDLEDLIGLCLQTVAPGGTLLFSCNLESMDSDEIQARLHRCAPQACITKGEQDLDFELPGEEPALKSFWIQT